MSESAYLRFPHLAGNTLAFVAEDDVWLAPTAGGRASRLTSDRVPVYAPRLNPSGTHVAWTSARDGGTEVHAVAVDGGVVSRLTHWGVPGTRTAGWLSDGEAVVISPAGLHNPVRPRAHAVSLEGGTRLLPYGPLSALDIAADGAVLVNSAYLSPPAYWKRYGGGTGGKIWLDPDGRGVFARVLEGVGNHLVNAMFVGGRIAFVSDHEGVGALYSAGRDGSDLRRHTDLGTYYVRDATTDGERVVYHSGGDIWLLASLDARPEKVEIRLGGTRQGRETFPVSTRSALGDYRLDHTGRVAAAEVRGTVHWLPAQDGPARTLLSVPGVRGRLPVVVPGRAATLCVSDAGGEEGLDLIPADGGAPRRIAHGLLGRVSELAVAPDGKSAAVASFDGRLLLIDLADPEPDGGAPGAPVELARGGIDEPHGLVFSPDSAYLAWAQPWAVERGALVDAHIRLARLADLEIVDVTPKRFDSFSPAFTLDGKYLAFLSNRTFDPVYDGQMFDLGFLPGTRPYLVTLAADTPSPFAPRIDGRPATPEQDGADSDGGAHDGSDGSDGAAGAKRTAKSAVVPLRVDLDGIAGRIVPFPVAAGGYRHLAAVKDGVLWLDPPTVGTLRETINGVPGDGPKTSLVRFDLGKRESAVILGAVDSYTVSGDGERIAYRVDGGLTVKPSGAKDQAAAVAVDLARIKVRIDPAAEWAQMYDEAWRLMRERFWREDMSGVDWPGMRERYRPLLDRIGTHDDVIDLLWELQGELGTSHAYVVPEHSADPAGSPGLLGADLAPDGDGVWRIVRVLPGESSVIDARSPLAEPGILARPGDAVTAVDGRPVDPARGPAPLLLGKADLPVELTLRTPGDDADRRVVVVPLASEFALRYHDLTARRRAAVDELSGGRLGYLHVPNMQAVGWAEFHRDQATQTAREGLIVDLRENGGGHTSQLVLEKLNRKVVGWFMIRGHEPVSHPVQAPRGPVVALADEMAGSDGDIGTHMFRAYGIGPVVGTRTWGGVVGIDSLFTLVDGTLVTQPRFAMWLEGPGWGVENHGVDPDVEVHIPPHDWAAGRDPQLETAVRMALEALEQNPAKVPPTL